MFQTTNQMIFPIFRPHVVTVPSRTLLKSQTTPFPAALTWRELDHICAPPICVNRLSNIVKINKVSKTYK